jgi:hypothetical protein
VTAKPLACTLLIGLEPSQVSKPLGDFQHTRLNETALLKLLRTLNKALGDNALPEAQMEKTFDVFWPKLKEKLDPDKLPPDGPTDKPKRTPEDLLAEILDTVRSTSQHESAHLTQLADAMSDIASMVATMESNRSRSWVIRDGQVVPVVPVSSLADAQRSAWAEPPPVPPELLETKSNQPVSKPRPAPRQERKLSHTSRKSRGTG